MSSTRMDKASGAQPGKRVAELFAGVGGFRLGLEGLDHPQWPDWEGREGAGWNVIWSNQWEPSTKKQHASDCYVERFGPEGHVCEDISGVMDKAEAGEIEIPDIDLLVGGFPCQDYSVAKVLSQASGISGRKGVLWWQIYRMLKLKRPRNIVLENVDRLLKSPASQRGRDFAVMLWCLNDLGYFIEWRVINAADYGFPQRRRRVFIVGHRIDKTQMTDPTAWMMSDGVLAQAFPISASELLPDSFRLDEYIPTSVRDLRTELAEISESFGQGSKRSRFKAAGVMYKGEIRTLAAEPKRESGQVLRDVLVLDRDVPAEFFVPPEQLSRWDYLKNGKKELREGRDGFTYYYNEGPVAFPEPLNQPSRTILTGEGGSGPSRFKLVVRQSRKGYRRLMPVELERLNGFPGGWTEGMPDARRAFMMGNALVVGVVNRIGRALAPS